MTDHRPDQPQGAAAAESAAPSPSPSGRALLQQMDGLALLQAMLAGQVPPAPMAQTAGIALCAASRGQASFRGQPGPGHMNPFGGVHGGWYGIMLDSALGCAVLSQVPQGHWYVTLDYGVNLLRALPQGQEVLCTAEVLHAGRSTAVARGEIRGVADGKLYASGQTTCFIMRQ